MGAVAGGLVKVLLVVGLDTNYQTAHAIAFFGEDPAQFGTDPYPGKGGFYGGPARGGVMEAFPWEHPKLLKMELRTVR